MNPYKKIAQKNPELKNIIDKIGAIQLEPMENVFLWMIRSIASQQLSTKVAKVIFDRFLDLLSGKDITPKAVLELEVNELRAIGFSQNKANYIHNIALYWLEHNITDHTFTNLTDEQVLELLLPIKGVGQWTVEMLLMFCLARPNVFSQGDLGIQKAMIDIYGWHGITAKQLKQNMLEKSKTYSPYSTYVCKYLWRYKDDL